MLFKQSIRDVIGLLKQLISLNKYEGAFEVPKRTEAIKRIVLFEPVVKNLNQIYSNTQREISSFSGAAQNDQGQFEEEKRTRVNKVVV